MSMTERRIKAIEDKISLRGCDDCIDAALLVVVREGDPEPETVCKTCGRETVKTVVRLTRVPGGKGPQ